MILLIKLILSHLLGDFVLQPANWVKAKETKKLKAWQLYAHTLLHGILIMLLVWDLNFIIPAIIIMISHGIIDTEKIYLQKNSTKRFWFAFDQILHLLVIAGVWYGVEDPIVNMTFTTNMLIVTTATVFLTTPVSVLIKIMISKWTPNTGTTKDDSLQNAGKFIGILERIMVFTFALINKWEAIGFLITAKSVFRFGDLKDAKDLKLTEYVLIGTLLSFGIAIATGLFITYVLGITKA